MKYAACFIICGFIALVSDNLLHVYDLPIHKLTSATDFRTQTALEYSVFEWSYAVTRPVAIPSIFRGDPWSFCGDYAALGCVHTGPAGAYSIIIGKDMPEEELRMVIMHEIGHLLGVPHIEGDYLMDASIGDPPRNALFPSKFAVVLAKEANGWK